MESNEDEEDAGAVICLQATPGQNVYSKHVEILPGTLPSVDKHIKVGVIVSLDDGSSDQLTSPPTQSNALALPDNVTIADLPENMTLETEWYETGKRKTMRMRLRPEPNTLFMPEGIKFNFICNYEADEAGEDQTKSVSSEEMRTGYFSDVDIEESGQNDKGVQTNIALGELLFSDSIASVPHPDVESVAVQTYITAINGAEIGEEGQEQGPDTEDEESVDKREAEHGGNIEKTSTGGPQEDEEEDEHCACGEEEKDEEEGIYCTCEEEENEEEEEDEDEEDEEEKEEEAVGDVEEPPTEEPQEAHEEEIVAHATLTGTPSGIPLCLLRGDPPWVDPLVDTFTVMWDTNLDVAPQDVDLQFEDTVGVIPSGEKLTEKDPLERMRQSDALSASFTVKAFSSDQSCFGSLMATSSSVHSLKRDPEIFNVHIDLNTWGFPAALYERYCKSATASVATFFDDQPSTGQIIYMTEDRASLRSLYNPDTMGDVDDPKDIATTHTEPTDKVSVGFITENGKSTPDIEHLSPPTKGVDAPEELQTEEVWAETSTMPEDMRVPAVSNLKRETIEGPRSISEYFSTVDELQSSANSSKEDLNEHMEEIRVSPNLPLSLVIGINDSRPLILLLDPQDLPISIAIGTKNVPVNNASAACAIKKLDGNMFHINNIDLKETAITNLELEKTESDKVRCNITIDGKVKGQTIADLGTLGSTVLLNLPLDCQEVTLSPSTEKENECLISEDTTLSENDLTEEVSIETEEGTFGLKWQEGLPVSEDISHQKDDSCALHPMNRNKAEMHPNTRNEAPRKFGDNKVPHSPERIKRKAGCRCKTSNFNKLPQSAHQSPYNKLPTKFNCGVLAQTLMALEQQISPLNEALDDIKYKMKALEVEDPGILLSPVCSEGSSLLSRSDSGYEQEMAERMSSAQTGAMTAKFPCMRNSSSHIQCVHDPSTELFIPCRKKSSLRTECCTMSGYMIQQSTTFNMPLDMDITYIVPTPVEVVATTAWPNSSLSRTPSELGCLGDSISSPTELLLPKISKWTNRR